MQRKSADWFPYGGHIGRQRVKQRRSTRVNQDQKFM